MQVRVCRGEGTCSVLRLERSTERWQLLDEYEVLGQVANLYILDHT